MTIGSTILLTCFALLVAVAANGAITQDPSIGAGAQAWLLFAASFLFVLAMVIPW